MLETPHVHAVCATLDWIERHGSPTQLCWRTLSYVIDRWKLRRTTTLQVDSASKICGQPPGGQVVDLEVEAHITCDIRIVPRSSRLFVEDLSERCLYQIFSKYD